MTTRSGEPTDSTQKVRFTGSGVFVMCGSSAESSVLAHALLNANLSPAIVGRKGPQKHPLAGDCFVLDSRRGKDSLALCEELSRYGANVVVILDCVTEAEEFIRAGASDFACAPIDAEEIVVRSLRCVQPATVSTNTSVHLVGWPSHIAVDSDEDQLIVSGKRLLLRRAEAAVFFLLYRAYPKAVCRTEILRAVSGGPHAADGTVRNQIYELRKKLTAAGAPDVIETVRGAGAYRLTCKPRRLDDTHAPT